MLDSKMNEALNRVPVELMWTQSRDKIIGFISTWDFMCETVRTRHPDSCDKMPSDNSKQRLFHLIEEATLILECLQKLIQSCCDVILDFELDISQQDTSEDSIIIQSQLISRALWGKDWVKLLLKSDITLFAQDQGLDTTLVNDGSAKADKDSHNQFYVATHDSQINENAEEDNFTAINLSEDEDVNQGELTLLSSSEETETSYTEMNKYKEDCNFPRPLRGPQRPPFECPVCNLQFKNMTRYKLHHLRSDLSESRNGCKGFPVPRKPKSIRIKNRYYCGHPNCLDSATNEVKSDAENWRSMTQLWRHFELRHAKESDFAFKCDVCREGFTTRAFLNVHIKEKHNHQFSCKFCAQTFGHRTGLIRHELRHTGEKPFKCGHCDYAAVTSFLLKRHNMTKHSKKDEIAKSHVCDQCGKAFLTRDKLRGHIGSHSEESHLLCQHCGKYLKNDSSYRRHLVGVHGIKFTCECCSKDFSSVLGLKVHRRDVHKLTIEELPIQVADGSTSTKTTRISLDPSM